jgi:hypothetical protein
MLDPDERLRFAQRANVRRHFLPTWEDAAARLDVALEALATGG